MQIFKRISLLLIVNFAILIMLSLSANIFMQYTSLGQSLAERLGPETGSLLIWCFFLGFGGAIISLLLSKFFVKKTMKVQVVDKSDIRYSKLYQMIKRLSYKANIKIPEIGVYPSNQLNAFATGPSQNNALVAVSEGLLNRMDDQALEGVLAHEIAHIKNGDMVTMTLLQGVLNTFVLFASRLIARRVSGNNNNNFFAYIGLIILFEIIFGLLATVIVSAFSRYREYRADSAGANLSSRKNMIRALEFLKEDYNNLVESEEKNEQVAAFKISSKSKLFSFLSTHPPLEKRIQRLKRNV